MTQASHFEARIRLVIGVLALDKVDAIRALCPKPFAILVRPADELVVERLIRPAPLADEEARQVAEPLPDMSSQ